jgi:hypothetical protein
VRQTLLPPPLFDVWSDPSLLGLGSVQTRTRNSSVQYTQYLTVAQRSPGRNWGFYSKPTQPPVNLTRLRGELEHKGDCGILQ